MKLHTFHSIEELGSSFIHHIFDLSRNAIDTYECFWIILSGGSLLQILDKHLPITHEDYSKWKVAFADERLVSFEHQDSNAGQSYRIVLERRGFKREQIYSMFGNDAKIDSHVLEQILNSPEEAAKRYNDILHKAYQMNDKRSLILHNPVFDCVLLGMGSDGHVASFFPGHSSYIDSLQTNHFMASLKSSVYLYDTSVNIPANESQSTSSKYTSWVIPVSGAPKPPSNRITLSLNVLTRSKQILFVVHGEEKAQAIRKMFITSLDKPKWLDYEWISNVSPGTAVHFLTNGTASWFIDEQAASLLKKISL